MEVIVLRKGFVHEPRPEKPLSTRLVTTIGVFCAENIVVGICYIVT
jgi:hypothetical protein